MNKLFSPVCLIILVAILSINCRKDSEPTRPGIAPDVPTLSSPVNGAMDIGVPSTLVWNTSNEAISYTLQVSTDSLFSNIVYDTSGLTTTNHQISGLNYSITYYWHVNATNKNGTSAWSSVWDFTTGSLPTVPTLSSPVDGAVDISVPPILSWNQSKGVVTYTLQVSIDGSFTSYEYNKSGLVDTSQQITHLNISTKYYWRVNATNIHGMSGWSDVWNFMTGNTCPGIPNISYLGKTYSTIQIGNQCWLKENLDVGTMISGDSIQSNNSLIEKFCYNDNTENCDTYGGLYQWDEAMQYTDAPRAKGICPPGWHIPIYAEFHTLMISVSDDGNALKAIGQGDSTEFGDGRGTNASSFSALLAGARDRYFTDLGLYGYFWSSTSLGPGIPSYMMLYYYYDGILFIGGSQFAGFSIRCLKD